MKFNCSTEKLKYALELVSKSVDANPTLPILNNILFQVGGKHLTLSATNLESAIKYKLEVEVINEGEITLPAKILVNYVSFLNEENVELSTINNEVTIKSGKSKTKIKGLAANEFPIVPNINSEISFEITSKELEKAIKKTHFICAQNNTRPVLAGIYLVCDEDEMAVVATDGYRLAEKVIKLEKRQENFGVVVPVRTMNELIKSLATAEKTEVIIGENQVMFKVGQTELYSRIIEGKFPDYKVIIPKEEKTISELKVSHLIAGVRQMSVLAHDNNNSIKIKTTPNSILLTASTNQVGEGEVEIPAVTTGEEIEVTLNSDFMLSALNSFEDTDIKIIFKDNSAPVVMRPVNADPNFLHLIMPLKS